MKTLAPLLLAGCFSPFVPPPTPAPACPSPTTNTCPDYSGSWAPACAPGSRCLTFNNACTYPVALTYNIGCNSNGSPGAPQCAATQGPMLPPGGVTSWTIVDSNTPSESCAWLPACLTSGLAVMANMNTYSLTSGTRIEFTAGNSVNIYGEFDSYDLDLEKGYSVPVSFAPMLPGNCAHDAGLDCRPLWCDAAGCPDAYLTPTTGGCPDNRSPQVGCQDSFGDNRKLGSSFSVNFCPTSGASCQSAISCSVP